MALTTRMERRGPAGFALAAILNGVLLLLLNAHALWRPLLDGLVTSRFVEVLWAANLSCAVQILGNLVLTVTSPPGLRRVMDLLFALAALVSAFVLYVVFPLDLARFGELVVVAVRVAIFLGVVAAALAIVVDIARLLAGRGGGPSQTPAHR